MNFSELANFIWSVADLLRGDYKQADYGKIILPFTLLRRLECVLEPTKADVLAEYAKRKDTGDNLDIFLPRKSKQAFYNVSPFSIPGLLADAPNIRQNMAAYLADFSAEARDVFERFKFTDMVSELDEKDLLFKVTQQFATIDLHPDVVPNETMGLVFEELIRKFAEASNGTAGEHFTPREVIKLIVMCLFAGDDEALSKPGVVRSLYDPTAGTGGMLSVGQNILAGINPQAKLVLFGQELNDESYAICKADMLIKGQNPKNIARGKLYRLNLNSNLVTAEFAVLALRAEASRRQIELGANGASSSMQNISQDVLRDLIVAFPPLTEQVEIVKKAQAVRSAVDELSAHVRDHIDRLKEYRASLISASVTGQLDLVAFKEAA